MLPLQDRLAHIVIYTAVVLHVAFTIWFASRFSQVHRLDNGLKDVLHTFEGDDYPLEYPIGNLEQVAMSLHESVHYDINASNPVATSEWGVLAINPRGVGRARLGSNHRLFVMTFHHQIHCLQQFQLALTNPNVPSVNAHLHHCFNYLRQTFLCVGADSLEKGDFIMRDYENVRSGDDLVCDDWTSVYSALDENYEDWLDWSAQWN